MDRDREGREAADIKDKSHILLSKPYIPYIVALLGTCGMQGITALSASENIRYSNSIFSFFVFILSAGLLRRIWPEYTQDEVLHKRVAGIFAALLSLGLHFGSRLEAVENVRMGNISMWLHIICLSLYILPIVTVMWNRIEILLAGLFCDNKADTNANPLNFFQIWAIIFLMWIPTFLALFPGAFVYDAQDEYIEVITRAFTTHHPLLHVLLLGGLVHGAEYIGYTANAGIAVYVLLQMAMMSGTFAYCIKKLEELGFKKVYLVCIMVFYGLFPIFPMYAVCTAKDGLFTAFLTLVIVELIIYVFRVEEFNPIVFTLASLLMMLMRNNGIYAYIASMAVIVICEIIRCYSEKKVPGTEVSDGRENEKPKANYKNLTHTAEGRVYKLLILTLLSIVLYVGSAYVLKIATQARADEHQEILTVPIQQLARTYTYSEDVFTEDETDTLHRYLPEEYLITYRFRISDVLKSGFNNAEYERDAASFIKLWKNIGSRKPLIYLNAWFGTSYGYWYPDALNNVYEGNQMYTFQYSDSSYFGFETEPPGIRDSKFPLLERFYENISLKQFQQKVPVVSQLFSPGFMWWLCAFVLFCIFSRGRKKVRNLIPLAPVVFVWLTVLLGPTTLVRYVLILWFVAPMYPVLINGYDDKHEKNNER